MITPLIKPATINNIYPTKKQKPNKNDLFNDSYQKEVVKYNSNIYFYGLNLKNDFDAKSYLQELSSENTKKIYYGEMLPNREAIKKLELLDGLTTGQKKEFIKEFCSMTGFPDFAKVTQNIENEISTSIHKLAQQEDFDIKFIGYDSNSSVGRQIPVPGSDCDGLFMIIDPKEHKEPWHTGKIRWDFKDYVNQRILSTPANHLPEVLSTDFIEQGLKISQIAFEKCNFSDADLEKYKKLLDDNSNDFVKSAEFNIRLAQKIPNGDTNRELYYKTAMLAEIIRDGTICENNFDTELYSKILNSPLYKYSNMMKQKGLKHSLKNKHIARQNLKDNFYKADTEQQFQLIKDILYCSLGKIQDNENKKYFSNSISGGLNEMGNIDKMYGLIINVPFDEK